MRKLLDAMEHANLAVDLETGHLYKLGNRQSNLGMSPEMALVISITDMPSLAEMIRKENSKRFLRSKE